MTTTLREAVARAICATEQAIFSRDGGSNETAEEIADQITAHDMQDPDFNSYWEQADAAIAAMQQAEPTDAEVIAAINAQSMNLPTLADGRAQMNAMRAALIAARTVQR